MNVQVWPWENASLDEIELAYRRMRAMFEFLDKLGVEYWCFHDRSVSIMASISQLLELAMALELLRRDGQCLQ
jgi:xylose isomerase